MPIGLLGDLSSLILASLLFVACLRLCNRMFGPGFPRKIRRRDSSTEDTQQETTSTSSFVPGVRKLEDVLNARREREEIQRDLPLRFYEEFAFIYEMPQGATPAAGIRLPRRRPRTQSSLSSTRTSTESVE